jgi:hypothetical protein
MKSRRATQELQRAAEDEKFRDVCSENLNLRNYTEDVSVNKRIILKFTLKKEEGRV